MFKIFKYELFSMAFISVFGVLLHFFYDWSNCNIIVSLFSAINESTWEHLKLLFFPSIFIWFLYLLININDGDYLVVKLKGIIIGLLFIVIFFYTYTGILGYHTTILDISSFFIAVIISSIYTIKNYNHYNKVNLKKSFVIISIITILFFSFTFKPIKINLFKDPINNSYGYKNTL